MATSIYVGNLPWSATQEGVESLFSPYGEVLSVKLVSDRETGRARGFGFVEMEDADAINAIAALDGKEFDGRALRVNKAEPKKPAPRRW
jgi:RNA recognition motif-containing protein